jgi:hypothetical protein
MKTDFEDKIIDVCCLLAFAAGVALIAKYFYFT